MIKVASYNMRKGIGTDRRRSPQRILDVLGEIDADIVALQEADRRFGTRAAVIPSSLLDRQGIWQALSFGARPASMGWHGNTILVRRSAKVVDCEAIHLPALEPRGAVSADIRLASGAAVRVVGMHLDLSGLWRRRQAHAIIAHIDACSHPLPTILMGDLNEWSATAGCLHEFGAALPHRRNRRELPCPPSGRAARPDHGLARPANRRLRRPCEQHRKGRV